MNYQTILTQHSDRVAKITLNRPHRLNAVVQELYDEVLQALDAAEKDDAIRTIVLGGEGRAFCVGADLKEHGSADRTPAQKRTYAEAAQQVCHRLQQSPKPTVAAVHGYALGAGAEMALSCDFVVMRADAEIGFPEISIGTYLGGGLTYQLPRLIGQAKAKELIFLGKRITGSEAERIGLIYKAVREEGFETAVFDLTEKLAALAPVPLKIVKEHLASHRRADEREALSAEVDALLKCMSTEDWAEGVRAFAEKRKPVFKGR